MTLMTSDNKTFPASLTMSNRCPPRAPSARSKRLTLLRRCSTLAMMSVTGIICAGCDFHHRAQGSNALMGDTQVQLSAAPDGTQDFYRRWLDGTREDQPG